MNARGSLVVPLVPLPLSTSGQQTADQSTSRITRRSLRKQTLPKIKTEEILFLIESTGDKNVDDEESRKRRRVLSSSSDSEYDAKNAAKSNVVKTKKRAVNVKNGKINKAKTASNTTSKKKQIAKNKNVKSKAKIKKTKFKKNPSFDSDAENNDNNSDSTLSSEEEPSNESDDDTNSDSTSSSEEESSKESGDDTSSDLVASQVKIKEEPAFINDEKNESLTEFEAIRKKNIEERMRLFQKLKIDKARNELEQDVRKTKQKSHRPSKVTTTKPVEYLPRRKSLRLEGVKAINYDDNNDQAFTRSAKLSVPYVASMASYARDWGDKPTNVTTVLPMADVMLPKFTTEDCQQVMSSCCVKLQEVDTKVFESNLLNQLPLKAFKSTFEALKLKDHHKVKVTPTRIYSMACHSKYDGVLLAAGCKSGAVGIWNPNLEYDDSDDPQIITFNHHVKPTSCVSFSENEPQILYSTSYDGTVRRGDLQQQTFTLVYFTPEEGKTQHVAWHHEISPGVLLVGQGDGNVVKVDVREPDTKPVSYKCYDKSVRTIDLHPVTKQHIVTASSTRVVSIWDLRQMKEENSKPLCNISFKKTLSGAFFSPITGDKLLTTSYDDNISVYSCSDLSAPTIDSKIVHNNNTGWWITNFKAKWHPQREDAFIVGAMDKPRKLQIYQAGKNNSQLLCNVKDYERFTTIGAVAMFHPNLPAVVCGNASGYIHLFI